MLESRGMGAVFLFGGLSATGAERALVLADVKDFLNECPLVTSNLLKAWDVIDLTTGQSVELV